MTGPHAPLWKNALSLQDRGRALEALEVLRELGRRLVRSGAGAEPLTETAQRLCGLYDFAPALELLRAADRADGRTASGAVRLSLLLLRENRFAEAADFARLALRRASGGAAAEEARDARLLLAECAERLGNPEESLSLTREVLAAHPGSIPAHRLHAAVLRRQGQPAEALEVLQPLITRGGPPHRETCRAWFELGSVQDACGRYADAWRSWHQARKHYEPEARWGLFRDQAQHVWRQVQRLQDSVTPEHFRRWRLRAGEAENRDFPRRLAVLTGHPRSGTTLLEQALNARRGLVSAEETTVFTSAVYRPLFQHSPPQAAPAQVLDAVTGPQQAHWRREYAGLIRLALPEEPGDRLMVDKNPDLLHLLPALLRIIPEVKIIVLLRDPRDILVSMFSQALPPNHTAWSYRSVEECGKMIALRLGLWLRLREMLPPEVFHEVRYEDSVRDFPAAVEGVLDFLECTPGERVVHPGTAPRRPVHSPTYAEVRNPVHTRAAGRWRHYLPGLRPALESLRPVIRALGYEE